MAQQLGFGWTTHRADLRRLARRCDNANQIRRMLALAAILDGGSRSEATHVPV